MDEMHCAVLVTSNYSKFKLSKENRSVKSLKSIEQSVSKIGQVPTPIIVNEKFEIIDGQHRFEYFKSKGLPIYYMIVKGLGMDHARAMNYGQKNWSVRDFLESYAASGNVNYIRFAALLDEYKIIPAASMYAILSGNFCHGRGPSSDINSGKLVVTEGDYLAAKRKLDIVVPTVAPIMSKLVGRQIYLPMALAWCMDIPGVDTNRLITKIKERYTEIRPITSARPLLEDISKIYNHRIRGKHIYFEIYYGGNN